MVNLRRARYGGFTLIELVVTMAILSLLLGIVAPRYWSHFDRSKEIILRQDLIEMRRALDRFLEDRNVYPNSLDELVERRYLDKIPVDPITGRTDTWRTGPAADGETGGAVATVHSGAAGRGSNRVPYADW